MITKLRAETGDNLVTVEAQIGEREAGSETGAIVGQTLAIHTYWHTPNDGRPSYLVVEIDDNDTDVGLKVVLNDATLYASEAVTR